MLVNHDGNVQYQTEHHWIHFKCIPIKRLHCPFSKMDEGALIYYERSI